jgi:RNA-directed DNA polymerase
MYENRIWESVWADDDRRRKAVTHHRGALQDFLNRHRADARRALREGVRGARSLAPHLLDRVADARTLRLAWDHLAAKGGQTPGPDGRRYDDYYSDEVWGLCRCLSGALRDGTYRPGPERIRMVAKASGTGERPLVVQNIADRVVQRAVVEILQPVLDPLFDKHTFGFRPGLGRLHALARAWCLAKVEGRHVWVAEDIQDAFTRVPLARLDEVLRKLLPDDGLLDLLRRVLPSRQAKGLRQGGPLSPLMLNLYLNHFLDRPWRKRQDSTPLLRVADDLLVLCRDGDEARGAQDELRRLLHPAGMLLKGDPAETAHDLGKGEAVDWLGFSVRSNQALRFEIPERSWAHLDDLLARAHAKADASLRAVRIVRQWLHQRGPSYPWTDRGAVCARVAEVAAGQAFEELPSAAALGAEWKRAFDRWRGLRGRALEDVRAEQENGFLPCP